MPEERRIVMFQQYKDTSYIIYDDGRCFSSLSNKFLTPKMSVTYPTYNLTIDGKKKQVKIHRMVAETFLPQPFDKNIVNHIDGDTHNFKLNNLEWVSEKENSLHAINTGLRKCGDQTINKFIGNLPNEAWKPVKDYPNYIVSSLGRVMNIRTKRLLKTYKDNAGGYYCVNLWRNNKGKNCRIHVLVYSHFYNDFDLKGYVINHKDGNKLNNNIQNLEKVTYQENNLHAVYDIKTNKSNKAVYQLDKNKNIIKEFPSITKAQHDLGITNISRAISKKGQAGGYYWVLNKRFNDQSKDVEVKPSKRRAPSQEG